MISHRAFDPRAKLAATTAVAVAAVAAQETASLAVVGLVLVGFVALGGDFGLREWVRTVAPVLSLVPLLLALNTLFYASGRPIWAVQVHGWTVGVTTGGVATAVRIALRLLVVTGVASWFAGTTEAEAFEAALARLGVPWSFAFLLSLTVRLVPAMGHRFRVVEEAQRSRGLSIEGGFLARLRARIPMFVPFLSAVIRYGYELGDALTARGFDRIERRTAYVTVTFRPADYALVAAFALGLALFFFAP